ncbi:MAG: SH3 domain-containing protein [Flavobacteriales bacterium]
MKFLCTLVFSLAVAFMQARKPYFLMKSPEKPLAGVNRVAVLDFAEENNKNYYDSYDGRGKKTTDQLIQAWMQEQRGIDKVSTGLFKMEDGETFQKGVKTSIFSFVERTEMERILKEQQLGMSGVIDDSQAATVGKILGIDAIISGSTNWSASTDYNAARRINRVKGTISMKIISVNTGQVLAIFSKDVTRDATSTYDAKSGNWSAMKATNILVDEAFDALVKMAADYIGPIFEQVKPDYRKIKVKDHSAQGKKAMELLEDQKDFEGAFTIYKGIVEADPYCAEALCNIAHIYLTYGNYEKAVEYYKQAAEIDREEYGKELAFGQKKLDEVPQLASIGVTLPVNELTGNAHSASAKSVKTRGGKSDRYEVYTGPDKGASVVSKVPGDTEFEILGDNGDFVKIKLIGGKEGYILKDNVKM